MQKNPCKNPNCNECSKTYNQNTTPNRYTETFLPSYPHDHKIQPELVETYGLSNARIIEEPNFPISCDIENYSNLPQDGYNCIPYTNNCLSINEDNNIASEILNPIISDRELLDYLLQKYHLNKEAVINVIIKQKEHRLKINLLNDFYNQFKKIGYKSIKEQYHIFKEWNCNGPYIGREELENYYEKYIKFTL